MEDFKNRLLEFARVQYDMGQSKFEDYCEINRGTISAIKVQGPTAQIVMKISSRCPELNLNWLFRGTGPMLIQDQPSSPATQNDIHHNRQVVIANWGDLKDVISEVIKAHGK